MCKVTKRPFQMRTLNVIVWHLAIWHISEKLAFDEDVRTIIVSVVCFTVKTDTAVAFSSYMRTPVSGHNIANNRASSPNMVNHRGRFGYK